MENESYVELRKKEGVSTHTKIFEKEGCAVMVKKAFNRIGAFFNSFANSFSVESRGKLHGRAGGGPPAKSGEGLRKLLRISRLRAFAFAAIFSGCLSFSWLTEGFALNVFVGSALSAACLSTLNYIVRKFVAVLKRGLRRLCSWCVEHKTFALCFAPHFLPVRLDIRVLILIAVVCALGFPILLASENRAQNGLYVAASEDGLEAWLQTHESGNVRHVAELGVPPRFAKPVMPELNFRPLAVDVEEIRRTPSSVIAAIMREDEGFAKEIDRLHLIAMDGCDGELYEKLNDVYRHIEFQEYLEALEEFEGF